MPDNDNAQPAPTVSKDTAEAGQEFAASASDEAEAGGPLTFRTSRGFQMLYSAPVLLIALLAADLFRLWSPTTLFLIGLTVAVAAVSLPRGWARVILDESKLTLQMPLRKPRTVHLRQLVRVERTQRPGHALVLRYRPMDERGRLDIANEEFLGLPPLEMQDRLEARLQPRRKP